MHGMPLAVVGSHETWFSMSGLPETQPEPEPDQEPDPDPEPEEADPPR